MFFSTILIKALHSGGSWVAPEGTDPTGGRGSYWPRGAAPRGSFRGTHPKGTQPRPAPGRWSRLDYRRLEPAAWFPARSRAGIQAFSRESPDAKSRGGGPPPPLFLWPARWHSLVLALGATLFRSMGYYGAPVRALIWMRILREQGLGEKAFRCGGVPPTKASPWGEAVTEGDG